MEQNVNIGINEPARRDAADGLKRVLADSYTLYLKSRNYHWNVTGPQFVTLHTMFEEHYTELETAVDDIAERIRALGAKAPGSHAEFAAHASIEEETGSPSAEQMVRQLAADHEAVVRTARNALPTAQGAGDEPTVGLLSDRMAVHEKTAWMLRSMAA